VTRPPRDAPPVELALESGSPDETERAGAALGAVVEAGAVIGLVGDLGAGKTLFVQGIARGLGVSGDARVVSPTFTLVNEYRGGRAPLVHADLYRLERRAELEHIGLDELLGGDAVCAVEWSDRFDLLPRDALVVTLTVVGDSQRRLTATAGGATSRALLESWQRALAT
jgi:tRNA threonylcarbamoyladenosine biosynthesis protein TsaE